MTMTLEQLHDWITRLPEPFQPVTRQTDAIEAAIRERDRLRGDVDGLRDYVERAEALQARLDALMLEFCPDDMTDEQRAAWAARQKPVED